MKRVTSAFFGLVAALSVPQLALADWKEVGKLNQLIPVTNSSCAHRIVWRQPTRSPLETYFPQTSLESRKTSFDVTQVSSQQVFFHVTFNQLLRIAYEGGSQVYQQVYKDVAEKNGSEFAISIISSPSYTAGAEQITVQYFVRDTTVYGGIRSVYLLLPSLLKAQMWVETNCS